VIAYVVSRFFDNSARALMLQLLDDEKLDAKEVERIRTLLDRSEAQ
jgi:predicted transcriptional regulator